MTWGGVDIRSIRVQGGLLAELALLTLILAIGLRSYYFQDDLLFPNSDFERGSLAGWTPDGPAFLTQPTYGDNSYFRGMGACGSAGDYWIGTFENRPHPFRSPGQGQGDGPVGRLVSSPFLIKRDRISFLLGGGDGTQHAGVALQVGGKTVLFIAGTGQSIRSERMSRVVWDVSKWKGQQASITVFDHLSGPWGHINVDDFRWA